jgi:hypothetical protein
VRALLQEVGHVEVVVGVVVESKPAAMTVTRTSSPSASSMTAPKMMLASGCATSDDLGGLVDLEQAEVGPPEMLSRMPRAPSMLASSSGLEIAASGPRDRAVLAATRSRCP